MRRNLIVAALALGALAVATTDEDYSSAAWRDEIGKGFLPYRKLTLQDFPVQDDTASKHTMYTQGFMHYHFDMQWRESRNGATASITGFTVRSGFDKNKSWRRSNVKNNPELLEHEQGHLDINELNAERLKELKDIPATKGIDYQEAMEKLRQTIRTRAEEIVKQSQAEQERYDAETNHGRNYVRQAEWIDSLHQRLADAKIKYSNE